MKYVIPEATFPIKAKVEALSPLGIDLKDSYTVFIDGAEFVLCTDITHGGIAVLKNINGVFSIDHWIHKGRRNLWAPSVMRAHSGLYVFYNDIYDEAEIINPTNWWKRQRLYYSQWSPVDRWVGGIAQVQMPEDIGMIDPDPFRIGNHYYIAYVVPDWKYTGEPGDEWQWWDIFIAVADSPFGPYRYSVNISNMTEYGIEEAPQILISKDIGRHAKMYWGVRASDVDQVIRSGFLVATDVREDGSYVLGIEEDIYKILAAADSPYASHPDPFVDPNGITRMRVTVQSTTGNRIAEFI